MNRLQTLLYVYETVRRVHCSYRRQLALGRQALRFISNFLEENPGAGRVELSAAFGEPAAFAEALLEYVDEGERAAEFRRKSWTRRAVVLLISGISLLLGGICALCADHRRK